VRGTRSPVYENYEYEIVMIVTCSQDQTAASDTSYLDEVNWEINLVGIQAHVFIFALAFKTQL
jgi:hypothetical protein